MTMTPADLRRLANSDASPAVLSGALLSCADLLEPAPADRGGFEVLYLDVMVATAFNDPLRPIRTRVAVVRSEQELHDKLEELRVGCRDGYANDYFTRRVWGAYTNADGLTSTPTMHMQVGP